MDYIVYPLADVTGKHFVSVAFFEFELHAVQYRDKLNAKLGTPDNPSPFVARKLSEV